MTTSTFRSKNGPMELKNENRSYAFETLLFEVANTIAYLYNSFDSEYYARFATRFFGLGIAHQPELLALILHTIPNGDKFTIAVLLDGSVFVIETDEPETVYAAALKAYANFPKKPATPQGSINVWALREAVFNLNLQRRFATAAEQFELLRTTITLNTILPFLSKEGIAIYEWFQEVTQ